MGKTLLSVEAVAEDLGLSVRTVRRLIADGAIPIHRIGRSVSISQEDLERYVAACRHVK